MNKLLSFVFASVAFIACSYTSVFAGDSIKIDTSKTDKGIVSVKYEKKIANLVKVQIQNDDKKYVYDIKDNSTTNFPLQMGTGNYSVKVLENVADNKYKVVANDSFAVTCIDENALYTSSIQMINFNSNMKAIVDLRQLTSNAKTDVEKLDIIYNYIISNVSYDFDKLSNLPNDYIPVIDKVYQSKKGICYDYSSLFASVLRELGMPTQLQMGYFTEINDYHAWNQVLVDGKWVVIDTTYDAQAKAYKMEFSQVKDKSLFTVVKQY